MKQHFWLNTVYVYIYDSCVKHRLLWTETWWHKKWFASKSIGRLVLCIKTSYSPQTKMHLEKNRSFYFCEMLPVCVLHHSKKCVPLSFFPTLSFAFREPRWQPRTHARVHVWVTPLTWHNHTFKVYTQKMFFSFFSEGFPAGSYLSALMVENPAGFKTARVSKQSGEQINAGHWTAQIPLQILWSAPHFASTWTTSGSVLIWLLLELPQNRSGFHRAESSPRWLFYRSKKKHEVRGFLLVPLLSLRLVLVLFVSILFIRPEYLGFVWLTQMFQRRTTMIEARVPKSSLKIQIQASFFKAVPRSHYVHFAHSSRIKLLFILWYMCDIHYS